MEMTEESGRGVGPGGSGGYAPPPTGGGAVQVLPLPYDFILWMAPKLAHYPRIHRFTLGDRIMTVLLEILDGLIVARNDRAGRVQALRQANVGLERLRYLVRLSREVNCLSLKEYEHAARCLVQPSSDRGAITVRSRSSGRHGGFRKRTFS
jgi:hypothetical protein